MSSIFQQTRIDCFFEKGGITITKVLDESGHKPKKIWVDKAGEFYNFSTHDKENSIAA